MGRILTTSEILDIEKHIEEIDNALDILDPSNAVESQEIERKTQMLEFYISMLEKAIAKPHLHLVN